MSLTPLHIAAAETALAIRALISLCQTMLLIARWYPVKAKICKVFCNPPLCIPIDASKIKLTVLLIAR